MAPTIMTFLNHTQRRITVGTAHLDEWSARCRDPHLETQHIQDTDIHDPGGIRTHNLSRRAAADLRLRPRGHGDRLLEMLACLLIYLLLTSWSRVLEKLTGFEQCKKFPALYGNRRFITTFTCVRHLSLSWASSIQSIPPDPTSRRSILILSFHLRLGLLSDLLHSGFPTKTLYSNILFHIRATRPVRPTPLDLITRIIMGEEYRSLSFSLCSFLHSPVTSSLLRPNLFSTLFSNNLSQGSSLSVSNQASHPYKPSKIIVLYIANWKTKPSAPNDSKHSLTSVCF